MDENCPPRKSAESPKRKLVFFEDLCPDNKDDDTLRENERVIGSGQNLSEEEKRTRDLLRRMEEFDRECERENGMGLSL